MREKVTRANLEFYTSRAEISPSFQKFHFLLAFLFFLFFLWDCLFSRVFCSLEFKLSSLSSSSSSQKKAARE